MWTTTYKGYFIHGYCDKDECRVQKPHHPTQTYWEKACKSLHAAKLAITKHLKESAAGAA